MCIALYIIAEIFIDLSIVLPLGKRLREYNRKCLQSLFCNVYRHFGGEAGI